MELTIIQLKSIMPKAPTAEAIHFVEDFNRYQWLHKISDWKELAAFLSQIAKETSELIYREEIASGSDYENRADLGNVNKGDGVLFKGQGWLQLTGRFNYEAFTIWYNQNFADKEDFVKNPKKISQEHQLCMLVSIFFWKTKKLDNPDIYLDPKKTTKKINGGYNGLKERIAYYNKALLVLNPEIK